MIWMDWIKDETWSKYNGETDEYELTDAAPDHVRLAFKEYIKELRQERTENPNFYVEPI